MSAREVVSSRTIRSLLHLFVAGVLILPMFVPETARAAMTGTFSLNKGARYTTERTVTGNSRVKGAVRMSFKTGRTWSAWEKYRTTKKLKLSAGDGKKTVYSRYRDARGKVIKRSDSILLDTKAPSGDFVLDGDPVTTSRLTLTGHPAIAGASRMRHRLDGKSWSAWRAYSSRTLLFGYAVQGEHTIEFQFRDGAGNRTTTWRRFWIEDAVLKIGTDAAFPPFEYKVGQEIVGFEVDLVAEIARRLGVGYQFSDQPFGGLLDTLEGGAEFDMVASAVTITDARAKRVLFSDAYYSDADQGSLGLVFNKSNTALRGAANAALAAMRQDGTYAEIYAKWF